MKRLITILFLAASLTGWGQVVTVDSYSESNIASEQKIYAGGNYERGETFTCTKAVRLDSAVFYLYKLGTISGNVSAKIFAHTGTYGTDGVPTGSALATSDNVAVSAITATTRPGNRIKFTFSGANKIILESNTYYVAVVSYNTGDISNCILVCNDNSTPSHSGNAVRFDGTTWYYTTVYKFIFYVYGIYQIKKIGGVTDAATKKVAGVADASIKKISGKTK